jgi:hypothetical protein
MRIGGISVDPGIVRLDYETAAMRHRVPRIGSKVRQARPKLSRVSHDRPNFLGKLKRDLDVLSEQRMQQAHRIGDQVVHLDP